MSTIIRILCIIAIPFLTSGQELSSDKFFQAALQELSSAQVLNIDPVNFPWIEEIIIRTETRDFDFDQQEYTLRIKPSTRKKRQAQAALLDHYKSLPDKDGAELYSDVIMNLYMDWIRLYFLDRHTETYALLQEVWEDKQRLVSKKLGTLEVDFDELMDLEIDKNRMSQSKFESDLEMEVLMERYGLDNDLSFSGLVDLDKIEQRLAENKLSNVVSEVLSKEQYETLEIDKEIALERAESIQVFDFAQLRYRGPHDDPWEERFTLGLGFRIDSDGNRRMKISKLMQERRQLERETDLDGSKRSEMIALLLSELEMELKIVRHFMDLNRIEKKNFEEMVRLIKTKEGFDPQQILDINEHVLKQELKALNYLEDVYFDYVKYLAFTGQLSSLPFINYLRA